MDIDSALSSRLQKDFAPLNTKAAAKAYYPAASLADELEHLLPATSVTTKKNVIVRSAPERVVSLFATGAVDMWLRGVHTFLISTSLTTASPLWACVSGYYASHYSVRAIAHLLGYFQLFSKKRSVRLARLESAYRCYFDPKDASSREHSIYWKKVKGDPNFTNDPLFTTNSSGQVESDVSHRDRCNYADHLGPYPEFRNLDTEFLKARIARIAQIQFATPPIPSLAHFPDVDSVQIMAYHRIVRFRQVLDEVLGGTNRYWKECREPSWTKGIISFQLPQQGELERLRDRI